MTVPPSGEHGGDARAVAAALGLGRADVIELSASLNPLAPDVRPFAAAALDAVADYPDPADATARLADAIGVDDDRLVLTNGGAEAIALVAAELGEGWIVEPEFSLYRRHLRRVRPGAPRWRSDPSNPLGRLAGPDEVAAVRDEAFYPLSTGRWTSPVDDGSWRIGSLTKLGACPGIRLGYVVAPDATRAEAVRARRPRWSVGAVALGIVAPALALTDLGGWSRGVAELRDDLAGRLRALGFLVDAADAPWLLVRGRDGLRERLAHERVVVRDAASFGLHGTVRVAVPRPGDVDDVVRAFAVAGGGT